jgi:DNA polymerase elongation subunit (family B)
MLTYLRNNKLVAPNKIFLESEEGEEGEEEEEKFEGAYVKDPIPGRYEWVCSADINSLYPSAIMTLNISPEIKLGKIEGWDTDKYVRKEISEIDFLGEKYPIGEFEKLIKDNNLAVSANGVIYDQNKVGCIPEILKVWFAQRVEFKNKMKECSDKGDKEGTIFWKRRQQVQKILLNSLYGVVGMKGWRFYDKDNAEAITLTGQSIIKTSEKFVNGQINKRCGTTDVDYIIAMDTDSLYINFAPLVSVDKPENPKMFCVKEIGLVAETLNKLYSVMVVRMYNSSLNRIVIAADVVTSAALWTSKKHYAMLKVYDMELKKDIDKLEVKGLDMVRSSYPKKFREFMGEVLMDLLKSTTKKELDAKILAFKAKMKDFELQDIAKNTGVAFVSKNENKVNYDPKGRDPFNFISKTTAQAKAALAYNDMLKKYKLSDTEPIMDGGKIKWVYLHDNPLGLDGLAFKDDGRDPKLIMDFLNKYVDRERIWESELQTKLEDFYSAVKWDIFSVDGAKIDEFFTF